MSILRIGKVAINVLDLAEARRHYGEFLGLTETASAPGTAYFKGWDEYDHHSVILKENDRAGLDHLAFKVRFPDDLARIESTCERFGFPVQRVSAGSRIGEGEAVATTLPTGHRIEFYQQMERVGIAVGNTNPEPWPDDRRGVGVNRFDHVLLTGEDLEGVTRFFVEGLDFHQSERLINKEGGLLASFLHVTNKAHDIAFIKGPNGKLHHVGFYVETWDDVLRAADLQSRHRVRTELTPSRHGLTRGLTTYFFDPSGNRNETYAGGTFPHYDNDVVTWTEDEAARAIFFHGREMIPSFGSALT
ncbi:catechol 2,3-dioxygenase [Immundisolibacter cernigliae]|uniref:Catechol 2,3-dioxygenase n=1 Tax=Immundisolibacter cernigliae TaxID=1810504 RepID=A0A1B1YWI7_9GAMM|nr:catechol 2,3-dioxygenase [Immundisolibacter cernigliae]ANX05076.1 catechol 2,3-dioxygenase [Immundisolibacter cernigliae]